MELIDDYPELQIRIRQFARTGVKLSKKARRAADAQDIKIHAVAHRAAANVHDDELEQEIKSAEKEVAAAEAKRDTLLARKKTLGEPTSFEVRFHFLPFPHTSKLKPYGLSGCVSQCGGCCTDKIQTIIRK